MSAASSASAISPASRAAASAAWSCVVRNAGTPPGIRKDEQLRYPLGVAESARAELEMEHGVKTPGNSFRLHPCFYSFDFPDRQLIKTALRIADLVGELGEGRGQAGVTGDRIGPQQRLDLPRHRPAPVVSPVGEQRPHQRSLLALGPQVGVDPQRRVGSRAAAAPGAGRRRPPARPWSPPPRRHRGAADARTARRRRCRNPSHGRRTGPSRPRTSRSGAGHQLPARLRGRRRPAPRRPSPR